MIDCEGVRDVRKVWILSLLGLMLSGCAGIPRDYSPREGDLVFQSLPQDDLVKMIEGSTHSAYSHCGIVVKDGSGWAVLEAVGPVKETGLGEWIGRGRAQAFAVYRLKAEQAAAIAPMIARRGSSWGGRMTFATKWMMRRFIVRS